MDEDDDATPEELAKIILEDSYAMTRSNLQKYLKSKSCRAIGTTAALRAAYVNERRDECGLEPSSSEDQASLSIKRPASPEPVVLEKRLKPYRSSCSSSVRDRIARARTQRLFLVEPPVDNNRQFVVMGSTGNLYTVKLDHLVHCTCPDHARGNLCKHILFVLLKVVGIPSNSPLLYQTAFLTSELQEIDQLLNERMNRVLGRDQHDSDVMANASVQEAYKKLRFPEKNTTHGKNGDDEDDGNVKRQPLTGDCPICFDELVDSGTSIYCKYQCGANFHEACMEKWISSHRQNPTCPNCRVAWLDRSTTETKEAYTNLGRLQGQSRNRDTRTYADWHQRYHY